MITSESKTIGFYFIKSTFAGVDSYAWNDNYFWDFHGATLGYWRNPGSFCQPKDKVLIFLNLDWAEKYCRGMNAYFHNSCYKVVNEELPKDIPRYVADNLWPKKYINLPNIKDLYLNGNI